MPAASGVRSRAFLPGCLYDPALVVALHHRQITLMIMILTVRATAVLFVWIPKGFFPQQDTGMSASQREPRTSPRKP
jgi:multidrug efflux pump subunit AcrB